MDPLKAPPISQELLVYLARLYPDRCPDPKWPERKVWMEAGAADVVRKLRAEHERQGKNLLEK